MSASRKKTGLLYLLITTITAALAASEATAQDTVGDYIQYLQQYPPSQKVQSAIIILFDQNGQPMDPDLWPKTVRADTQIFAITAAACGVIASRPVLLEQQAGSYWHRWCADPQYPYVRRDTYYFANGRLTFLANLSLQRHCDTQLALIPLPVQVVCD